MYIYRISITIHFSFLHIFHPSWQAGCTQCIVLLQIKICSGKDNLYEEPKRGLRDWEIVWICVPVNLQVEEENRHSWAIINRPAGDLIRGGFPSECTKAAKLYVCTCWQKLKRGWMSRGHNACNYRTSSGFIELGSQGSNQVPRIYSIAHFSYRMWATQWPSCTLKRPTVKGLRVPNPTDHD
jgi:hypothetical protein